MDETHDVEMRRIRAANNQSLFREVNERIEDLTQTSSFASFVCECLDTKCAETLTLTIEEYEHVRRDSNRFLVLPGHEVADVEEVLESTSRYLIVAKLGSGAAIAARFDPRTQQRDERPSV